MIGTAKVVGSAQRKHRGALLQHGGILVARSPHSPELPGIRELTDRDLAPQEVAAAVVKSLAAATAARVVEAMLAAGEVTAVESLKVRKYGTREWNCKR